MLRKRPFKLSIFGLAGLMIVSAIVFGCASMSTVDKAAKNDQQIPPKFIIGKISQSILDVKTKGYHIGDTTKTVAPNISGYDDVVLY